MTEITAKKVHEEQVTGLTGKMGIQAAIPLTKANAHRANLILRKGTDEKALPFHFRKKCTGMHTYIHTYAEDCAMQRLAIAARPEEEKQEEAWSRLKRGIASSAKTIHEIDTGKARGYSRALFASSILSKASTFANRGEVKIV